MPGGEKQMEKDWSALTDGVDTRKFEGPNGKPVETGTLADGTKVTKRVSNDGDPTIQVIEPGKKRETDFKYVD